MRMRIDGGGGFQRAVQQALHSTRVPELVVSWAYPTRFQLCAYGQGSFMRRPLVDGPQIELLLLFLIPRLEYTTSA